ETGRRRHIITSIGTLRLFIYGPRSDKDNNGLIYIYNLIGSLLY
ncbi:unnamed protein product, partial [Didymodactylos carnosus]